MKHPVRWAVLVLIALGLAMGIGRAIVHRKAQQSQLAQSEATARSAFVELGPADWVAAGEMALLQTIPVSGSVKAVDSAVVKAKVSGELKSLAVREGDAVRRGQLLGEIDTQEYETRLRQAREQAASAKAQLDIARQTLANNQALVQQGFISKNALDTSVSNAAAATASLQAAQAAVDLAAKALLDTQLRAPLQGQVSQRFAQAGERVSVDARVLEIVDLSRLELESVLTPDEVARIRLGSPALLRVDGLSQPVKARVARISPSANAGSRGITAYFSIVPQPGLRQGLFAQGEVQLDRQRALAVPASSVHTEGERAYVLLIEGGKVTRRFIQAGASGQAVDAPPQGPPLRVVAGGLEAGDRILTGAAGALPEGTPVRFATAAP